MVRADSRDLPDLPVLPIAVQVVGLDAPVPPDAERVTGDEYLGVRIANEESRLAVEWALMQTCRRPFDGPGDRHVTRPVSLRITR